ncbi:threonine-phosphate decarboxylase CobD [Tepidibacillus fermentans]|uniref:threonine-phosphate decarboxylase n=1 Tax=Tepidibacillus fermentans TaxID=1281767 RepID=A0A4R3KAB8_9BACI|nr:threonine-phosphate decarboxylase CobD [Tepidibacillus fermentans]TCS79928.1 L-threonine O-3-phosphate decarboxylase [Tepidibacillus fermentans]
MKEWIQEHIRLLSKREHGSKSWAELDFSINTNPLGPPASVMDFFHKSDQSWIHKYPVEQAYSLKEQIAKKLKVNQEQVVIGNGAAELFFLLPRVLRVNRGVIVHPTFSEYEASLQAANVPIKRIFYEIDGDRFIFPLERLKAILSKGDLLYICRPNNPTGQMVSLEEMVEVIRFVKDRQALLVVDESFIEFTNEPLGLIELFHEKASLILVRSLTKFYSIPGIRLGYAIGPSWLIHSMEMVRDPWTVNALAQQMGILLLDDISFIEETRTWVQQEREWFYQEMKQMDEYHIYPTSANFYLVRTTFSARVLEQALKKKRIAIRLAHSFPGLDDHFIRLAIKTREENLELLKELKQFVLSSS